MMDREKLIELTCLLWDAWADAEEICSAVSCEDCPARPKNAKCMTELAAAHLLAHGVTVQEWISVEDRLPEKNTYVLVATDTGNVFGCLYAYDGWDLWEGNEVNITHWQPMPQPPKGERLEEE